jgi:hypothetical protein
MGGIISRAWPIVKLTFKLEGCDVTMSLGPDEVSGLVSHLLAAANALFIQSGKSDEAAFLARLLDAGSLRR